MMLDRIQCAIDYYCILPFKRSICKDKYLQVASFSAQLQAKWSNEA